MSGFDAGHPGANAWFAKAGMPDNAAQVRTHLLVCGEVTCAFYSLRQISVRGKSEDGKKDSVASLVVWLALDSTHQGAQLGRALLIEVLAACVDMAAISAYSYIMLDLAPDAADHVGDMYKRVGFSQLQDGRFRMKVSLAKNTVDALRQAGHVVLGARGLPAVSLQA